MDPWIIEFTNEVILYGAIGIFWLCIFCMGAVIMYGIIYHAIKAMLETLNL